MDFRLLHCTFSPFSIDVPSLPRHRTPAGDHRRIAAAYFLFFAAFGLYLPYFPAYLRGRGLDSVGIGMLLAVGPLMRWVLPPVWGMLADRFRGPRFWGTVAAWGTVGGLALIVLGDNYALLLAGGFIFFAFQSPLIPLLDSVALNHLARTPGPYGRIRLWGSIGFIITSLALGLSFPELPAPVIGVALIGAYALFALWYTQMRVAEPAKVGRAEKRDYGALLGTPAFIALLAAVFLHRMSMASYGGFYTLFVTGRDLPGSIVAWTWGIGVTTEVFVMLRIDRLIDRLGAARVFALGALVDGLRWLFYATVPSTWGLLAVAPLHGIGFTLSYVSMVRMVGRLAGERMRASGQGLASASAGGGEMLGLVLAGWFFDTLGDQFMFAAAAAFAGLSATVGLLLSRRTGEHLSGGR